MDDERRNRINGIVFGVVIVFVLFGLYYLLDTGSLNWLLKIKSFSTDNLVRPFSSGVQNFGDAVSDMFSGFFR